MTKLPYVESAGIYYFQGKQFKTLEAVELAEQRFIDRAEKIAGKPLTIKELLQGVPHPEDRDRAQQASDRAFHVMVVTDKPRDTRHPFDQVSANRPAQTETREMLHEKMRDAYDQRIAAENKAPEPRRAEAIAHAHELWASVAYDKSISMSLFVRAQQLIIVAQRAPDIAQYKAESGEFLTKLAEHKAATLAKIEIDRAQRLADLPDDFEPVEPLPAEAPAVAPHSESDIVAMARKGDGVRAAQMLRENEAFKREATSATSAE